jgi:hypothetical protein
MYVRSVNVTVTGLVAGARRRFLAKKAAQVIIFEVKKSSQVAGLGTVPAVSVIIVTGELASSSSIFFFD